MKPTSRLASEQKYFWLSLGLHFAVAVYFWYKPTPPPVKDPEIVFEYINQPPVVETRPQRQVPKQIVEQEKPINNKLDKDTNLVSSANQKVEKQTRAKSSGEFKNSKQATGNNESLPDLSKQFAANESDPAFASGGGERSQTNDYLKDVEEGMKTLLNTREFAYYSYYAKIREAIQRHWEPNVKSKVKIIYRDGRSVANEPTDRVTQIVVTLNKHGGLIDVEVIGQSGIESLDHAAIEAFKAAAPFPNPPDGIVESNGTIRIRWDFVLAI